MVVNYLWVNGCRLELYVVMKMLVGFGVQAVY